MFLKCLCFSYSVSVTNDILHHPEFSATMLLLVVTKQAMYFYTIRQCVTQLESCLKGVLF